MSEIISGYDVVSLYDRSGIMVKNYAMFGAKCLTIDIEPATHSFCDSVEMNIDSISRIDAHIIFAFPPCTDLANSGSRWWKMKGQKRIDESKMRFKHALLLAQNAKKFGMVENPPRLSSQVMKPTYSFQPYQYAEYGSFEDRYQKKTMLWTFGNFRMPPPGKMGPAAEIRHKIHMMGPSADRGYLRSITPQGFANAVYQYNPLYL